MRPHFPLAQCPLRWHIFVTGFLQVFVNAFRASPPTTPTSNASSARLPDARFPQWRSGTSPWKLHVIGDVHGDLNFLVRALLSTELFTLDENHEVVWAHDLPPLDEFDVAVLGDMIDRGTFSRQTLKALKRLTGEQPMGSQLHVFLGNHECMLLRGSMGYAGMGWTEEERWAMLTAPEGTEEHDLITWVRNLPAMLILRGVLLVHGGMAKTIMDALMGEPWLLCGTPGLRCGQEVEKTINEGSRSYYEKLHDCMVAAGPGTSPLTCSMEVVKPRYLSGKDGILWFRGFSAQHHNAGSSGRCSEVSKVARQLGVHAMVMGHTAHAWTIEYCSQRTGHLVPTWVVDTHRKNCSRTGECDFHLKHVFHGHASEPIQVQNKNVPQSLRIVPMHATHLKRPRRRRPKSNTGVNMSLPGASLRFGPWVPEHARVVRLAAETCLSKVFEKIVHPEDSGVTWEDKVGIQVQCFPPLTDSRHSAPESY